MGVAKLGYHEAILKRERQPGRRRVQEEVKCRLEAPTIFEHSGVGGSQANGAAERVAQAFGEQVRFLHQGLEARQGISFRSARPLTACLVEDAADIASTGGPGMR